MSRLDEDALKGLIAADTFVPPNLRAGLLSYIEDRQPTGDFLRSLLSDSLFECVLRADPVTVRHIPTVVRWVFNFAPAACWGSSAKVSAWTGQKTETALSVAVKNQ